MFVRKALDYSAREYSMRKKRDHRWEPSGTPIFKGQAKAAEPALSSVRAGAWGALLTSHVSVPDR